MYAAAADSLAAAIFSAVVDPKSVSVLALSLLAVLASLELSLVIPSELLLLFASAVELELAD